MDEYVGCIRQRVLERMDLSREMSDEEIENLIGEEASRLMQEEPISIRERLMLEARVFNSLGNFRDHGKWTETYFLRKGRKGSCMESGICQRRKNAGCDTADRWKT